MTPRLCMAGRVLLGWTQERLADLAEISRAAASDYEMGKVRSNRATVNALRMAFDKAGVEFFGPPEDRYTGIRIFDQTLFDAHKTWELPQAGE